MQCSASAVQSVMGNVHICRIIRAILNDQRSAPMKHVFQMCILRGQELYIFIGVDIYFSRKLLNEALNAEIM